MNILGQIQKISVEVNASLKDDFVGLKLLEIGLPGEFPNGIKHKIIYSCSKCKGDIDFSLIDKKGFDFLKRADIKYFNDNREPLELIGKTFDLNPDFKLNDNGTFSYYDFSFTGKYKSVADIAGFHCPHCRSKYLMSYACYEGENEKAPEPDIVYIDKILMVDMDFGELSGMV